MQQNLQKHQQYITTHLDGPKVIDSQGIQYEFVCYKLRQILQTLTMEKTIMQNKIENQRLAFKEQLAIKKQRIQQLQQQNNTLKKQLGSERERIKSQVAYLKKKNAKLQLQRDSLTNIIHYLQMKSKQLNQEMYQLKKNKNRRVTQSQTNLSNIFLSTQYDPHKCLQKAHISHKLISPNNIYRVQSSQVSLTAIKNNDDQSEKITKKAMQKMGLNSLQRIRSIGQINETTRNTVVKAEKKLVKNHEGKESTFMKGKTIGVQLYEERITPVKKIKRFDSS